MATVILDMDGVMVDLHKGLARWLRFDMADYTPGEYDLWKVYPHHMKGFSWDDLGENFWANIEPTSEASQIMQMIHGHNSFVFTCPINFYDNKPIKGAMEGKLRWLQKYMPIHFEEGRYLFGRHKHFIVNSDMILIDDHDEYVNAFNAAGGRAILFPRLWNSEHENADKGMELVKAVFETWTKNELKI